MVPTSQEERPAYFGAGPAKLPTKVLRRVQDDIMEWRGTGVGILEVTHRAPEFLKLMEETEESLRRIVQIPPEYSVLFMPGGGTLQFASVIYNLLRRDPTRPMIDYLVSGSWSSKAVEEAKKILPKEAGIKINAIPIFSNGGSLIPPAEWTLSENQSSFVYYCDNETIDGVEMPSSKYIPDILMARGIETPLVVDMSSNFLSRPIDVTRFGLIFATAQKNFGPAGVTVVIVRRSLLVRDSTTIPPLLMEPPTILDYAIFSKHSSLYNTPPCFAICVCSHVFTWIEEHFEGDLNQIEALNNHKAQLLYNCLCESEGFFRPTAPSSFRSRMNVVFRICRADGLPSEELEDKFVLEAKDQGLLQLRGHRSVGGIRVSLYNAVSIEDTMRIVTFMHKFFHHHFSE